MSAPARRLRLGREVLELGDRPLLMGILNVSPESFSDGDTIGALEERMELAARLLEDGAALIDVGGESGVTNRPALEPEEEIARVVPLVRRLTSELGARVSVDTYKPAVARAAVEAGACLINDVSGLRDPELARVAARGNAGLVIMHTRARPKTKWMDRAFDGRMAGDVKRFLAEQMELAAAHGVQPEQILLDPGPDFGKTPAQTVEVLHRLRELHDLDRPILLPVSRKDFIGAITRRRPRERLAGTLAAIAHGVCSGAHILRVHDVREVRDFLDVLQALGGEREVPPDLELEASLRREPPVGR